MTAEQTIQKVETDGRVSKPAIQAMRDMLSLVNSADNVKNIEEFETQFKSFENKVYATKELTDEEKIIIAGSSAVLRGSVRFQDEMTKNQTITNSGRGNVIQLRENCLFGRKLSCFGTALLKAGVKGLIATIKTGSAIGGVTAFLFGSIESITDVFLSSSCKCADQSGGCFQPEVINPIINGNNPCSPYIGFAVFGSGTVPQVFKWSAFRVDANGVEHAIPDVQNKTTAGPALAPFPIPNFNETIKLNVVTLCNGNDALTVYEFKVNELLGDPCSVFISGNTDPWVGSTQWYYASGSYLVNPFNTFQWSFNLYQGSFTFGNLVSGGGTNSEAAINWTGISCGQGAFGSNNPYSPCYRLSIGGYSANPCSGSQGWGSAQVGVTP